MTTADHTRSQEPLLTVRETARRLSVSQKTVRRLIDADILPALRISSRTVRVDPGELHAWLHEDTAGAGGSASSVPPGRGPGFPDASPGPPPEGDGS